ncbi:MAG: hypothetical protein A3C85_03870 [Candidatus Doudnabacteria bacterium RIFCSPHIGHO2_02_FULL_48_21]|uniref:Glycosyl transferase family 1 domain-containing protein n=1 Tax=Candidatus Doudnabacteria bacterium RIFCSPLOWO2_02_FULL_48_13 TaxID=1817845 RepID=A0A1F5QBU1_9BACT|nr:MAG: hypothetical protein A3K05_03365 [Candidatus Doudnabacteria bacterium RIFCSPHIGHO2_01_48_18]OGE77175.1 MAG: hypothetical protein A2668_01685 [Candidatus Doudnabacteria bacterium RIFCSPHIGHO2_01_FULL_48_180]OGE91780.1 MAG: hypothetical protein A3F44_00210 [Candidatus Doudnabacteria bacterium RIFCSPHIGHO2_12_FULL_47_25]OGE93593.1 MAG: hypothetical protein A3C85_03870 [Candidatus Doudnabacteria bacterium RIFCSPHIGHO2_02_FULL_48_21]OGE96509.1 MAG: hypothetical protein A3A83_04250 [Candidatu
MRLIFITRKVDRADPLTGFVFGWIEALARNLQQLYVICQEKGDASDLPANVAVYSFGKEKGYGRIKQALGLFAVCFRFARHADGFLVHMHPVYAVLAALPARLFGKKIALWYTHKSVDLKLKIAHAMVNFILTASKESFRINSPKVKVVGHGIDLSKFKFQNQTLTSGKKFRLLTIGRISPVKDYETLIKAVEILVNKENVQDLDVQIYGKVGLVQHQKYLDSLVRFVENAGLDEIIDFQGEVQHDFVPQLINEADIFVNLSMTGSLDKNVLEAAASGRLVLTSNEAFEEPFKKISPDLFFERNNAADLAKKIMKLKTMPESERRELTAKLRSWVEQNHDLEKLAGKIVESFS